ncbi:MAG: hypothetical protein K6U09_11970 [Acidobacteriia bacterium]|jgi:hypothetical protein|nr:hypothetical protein [Terriglobia bacterium]
MPLELELVPAGTVVEANGEASPVEISASTTRTFLCTLEIFQTIEQQSLDLSIWGSADGQDFGRMPLLKFPQRFYRGVTRLLLDVTLRPEVRFLRARWEVNRWGRVAPTPRFVIGLRAVEVPPMPRQVPVERLNAAGEAPAQKSTETGS